MLSMSSDQHTLKKQTLCFYKAKKALNIQQNAAVHWEEAKK